jgi:hypothetical protein
VPRPGKKPAPLPSFTQYLNVIESVFGGLTRAVIHNSDYLSLEACQQAITRHFEERNRNFRENPKRAGIKYGAMSPSPQVRQITKMPQPQRYARRALITNFFSILRAMFNNSLWIGISGLAGALLSQVISAASVYWNENRKDKKELRNRYREKKLEIGENFYFMNGERMDLIRKNIQYWKSKGLLLSEASRDHLNREMNKLIEYMDKISAENWKYNLVNLYFKVKLNNEIVHALNARSHAFYLRVLDISERLKTAPAEKIEEMNREYAVAIFDLCAHYEQIYQALDADLRTVKGQLLAEYGEVVQQ